MSVRRAAKDSGEHNRPTLAAVTHLLGARLQAHERTPEVHPHDAVPFVHRHVDDRAPPGHAGVHQGVVQRTEATDGRVDR